MTDNQTLARAVRLIAMGATVNGKRNRKEERAILEQAAAALDADGWRDISEASSLAQNGAAYLLARFDDGGPKIPWLSGCIWCADVQGWQGWPWSWEDRPATHFRDLTRPIPKPPSNP
jgi:hypothetical protein